MKKRSMILFLILALLVSVSCFDAAANEGEGMTYEVAILVDISGSMPTADPERISIEAAKAFAYYYPTQAEYFNISVILYNNDVVAAVKGVNVVTEEGMTQYQDRMTQIGNLKKGETFEGIKIWNGFTDIGKAVAEADEILANSSAEKKAVILFTDGKVDLGNNNAGEKESEEKAFACAEKFAKAGVPVYTVGLNYNNGVDADFLQEMADITAGEYQECKSADVLMGLFQKMYAYFVGGSVNNGGSIQTKPNVESTHKVNLYGQAISEANLVLFSNAVINSYTVTNPDGVVVAQLKSDGTTTSSSDCIVHRNDLTVNVKLLYPMDGYWTITFTSETAGTVQIGEIYLYSLEVAHDSEKKMTVEGSQNLNLALYNKDKKFHITTQELYESATCTVTVSGTGVNNTYAAKLNSAKNGYELSLQLDRPGEYQVTYCIAGEQFSVTTETKITVLPPDLVLSDSTDEYKIGQTIEIVGRLVDPLTGKNMQLPNYLAGSTVKAQIACEGKQVATVEGKMETDGTVRFFYTPDIAGKLEISAEITGFSGQLLSKNKVNALVHKPAVEVSVSSSMVETGETIKMSAQMKDPLSGEVILLPGDLKPDDITAVVKRDGNQVATIKGTVVNESTIEFVYVPQEPGDYSISVSVKLGEDELTAKQDVTFVVWWPAMVLELTNTTVVIDQTLEGVIFLKNPASGAELVPDQYLTDNNLVAEIKRDGTLVDSIPLTFTPGAMSVAFTYVPNQIGTYTVTVRSEGFATEEMTFTVDPSAIAVSGSLEDVTGRVLFGKVKKEIDLRQLFVDSDGDQLNFTVNVDGEGIAYELDGGMLYIEAERGATGTITIHAEDGHGAQSEAACTVEVKSSMPLFITGIVLAVLLAVGIPVGMSVLNKRRIPRMRYRIQLTLNGDRAVFDIGKASSVQRAKPVMTLKEILNTTTLATLTDGDMSLQNVDKMIERYGSKITVTGFAFKEGIRILTEGGKEKVLIKHIVSVPMKAIDEDDWEIAFAFGKTSDFREED